MEETNALQKIISGLVRGWFTGIILTVLLFLVAAGLMCAVNLPKNGLLILIYVIYITASMVSGLVAGKNIQYRKFLWGLLAGALYYVTVCLVASLSGKNDSNGMAIAIPTLLMCLGSGMFGGMIAK